jgi:L-glutamine-phosphate cytidylyltransferase
MAINKAIILAAGNGSRLRPLTNDRPKCLLDVDGHPLIDHQLDALRPLGVTDVVVVVGYCGAQIRRHVGGAARYVENVRWASTNSLYSLWLARDELGSGALILNSDVLAPNALFERLVHSPAPDAVLVQRGSGFEAEDMKVMLRGVEVVDFGKDLPPERAHAHNVGVAKFSVAGGRRLAECLDLLVAHGHDNDWVPVAFRAFASEWPLIAVATDGLPWIEIDYAADLDRARLVVQPAIRALGVAVSPG